MGLFTRTPAEQQVKELNLCCDAVEEVTRLAGREVLEICKSRAYVK